MKNSFKQFILGIYIIIFFQFCTQNYDKDLMNPDGYGGGYNLTILGCLVAGPWHIDPKNSGYNTSLYINGQLVSSKGVGFNNAEKDLVFKLNKDGSIVYWFKSENLNKEDKKNTQKKIKFYEKGYWKLNKEDSTFSIYFQELKNPICNFKYADLGSSYAYLQQISYYDSVCNNKKVKVKMVNSIHYDRLPQ